MNGNLPKCLQVLKNRQMQKNEARQKQQNASINSITKSVSQQSIQRNYENENTSNYQYPPRNYDDPEKVQRKPLGALNNVNLQYRYPSQQNQPIENPCSQMKQDPQELFLRGQQRRSYQTPQYSPIKENYQDNYSNDVSNSNLDDSPMTSYQYSPKAKENYKRLVNDPLTSSPQDFYMNSNSQQEIAQSMTNESLYVDPVEYKMLIEKNKNLEKQIEILQMNQKSIAEMNSQAAQLEDALNRISDLEQIISAKEKKFQIATDAISQFQSEINELTVKFKQQGKELLQAQKRVKDLELSNEKLMSQIQESQYANKFNNDDIYAIESNQNKFLSNQRDYFDDGFDSKRKFSRFADDNANDVNMMNPYNQRGRLDDDFYNDRQEERFNDFDQYQSKFNSNKNLDFGGNQIDAQSNKFGNSLRQKNDAFNPIRISQEPQPAQNQYSNPQPQNKQSTVHPAMKDNLFFGDDQPEKKDNYDLIVQELRDDEIRNELTSFTREKEEKERILNKAPEKGISISKSRRIKEQLEDEVDDLSRKIGILKREMKQRGIYC